MLDTISVLNYFWDVGMRFGMFWLTLLKFWSARSIWVGADRSGYCWRIDPFEDQIDPPCRDRSGVEPDRSG